MGIEKNKRQKAPVSADSQEVIEAPVEEIDDDIVEKVEDEVKNYSLSLNEIIVKEEAGTEL